MLSTPATIESMEKLVVDQGLMTLVTIAIFAGCAVFVLYVLYSVVWRAVRRGLREYDADLRRTSMTVVSAPLRARVRAHLPVRVPDRLPNDWE